MGYHRHKSQGLTSAEVIDFTGGVFAGGQAYGTQPLHLTGRYPIEETDQPRRYFCTAGNRKLAQRFNNRQAIDKL